MGAVNWIVLFINFTVVGLICLKVKQFKEMQGQYLQIQKSLEEMARENSRVIDLILKELEEKLQESRQIVSYFEENTFILPDEESALPYQKKVAPTEKNPEKQAFPANNDRAGVASSRGTAGNHSPATNNNNRDAEIVRLFQEGLTVREIAEKLHITQGEVLLKIKLRFSEIKVSEIKAQKN